MAMTSKERVRAALRGGVPNRIPLNCMANAGIDERLKKHCGLDKADDEGLLRALGKEARKRQG